MIHGSLRFHDYVHVAPESLDLENALYMVSAEEANPASVSLWGNGWLVVFADDCDSLMGRHVHCRVRSAGDAPEELAAAAMHARSGDRQRHAGLSRVRG